MTPLTHPAKKYWPGGQWEQGHGLVLHDPGEGYHEPTLVVFDEPELTIFVSQGLTLSTASQVSYQKKVYPVYSPLLPDSLFGSMLELWSKLYTGARLGDFCINCIFRYTWHYIELDTPLLKKTYLELNSSWRLEMYERDFGKNQF